MTSRSTKTAVIGALATLGALAWSGCGPGADERYYCDNGGCYSCDAYGCTDVKGPAHPTCSSNAQCASGVCTTKGCTIQCSNDSSCPKGETCQSGLCFAPGGGGTTLPGTDGGTTPPKDGGDGLGVNCGTSVCTGTDVCVNGTCTAPQNACKYSSECDTGKVCADGACLKPCTGGACDDGYTCKKDVCQPNSPTGDSDGGTTPTSCASDPVCGTGKYCNNGTCTVDTRPKPNCTVDTECKSDGPATKCLAGYCRFTCTGPGTSGDQYCRTIDSRIGTCASDNVCRSSKEAAPQCTGPGTCPLSGQSCIDNQCK